MLRWEKAKGWNALFQHQVINTNGAHRAKTIVDKWSRTACSFLKKGKVKIQRQLIYWLERQVSSSTSAPFRGNCNSYWRGGLLEQVLISASFILLLHIHVCACVISIHDIGSLSKHFSHFSSSCLGSLVMQLLVNERCPGSHKKISLNALILCLRKSNEVKF